MKKVLMNIAKKSEFFRNIFRKLLLIKRSIQYRIYMFNKVDDKLIIFESFNGRMFSDSPKAMYLYMSNNKDYKDYKFVWAFINIDEKKKYFNNKNTTFVKYRSKDYYKYYSKAKYFISNSRIPDEIKKKKDQIYIQTWHGTPLKRLGFDLKSYDNAALNSLKDMKEKYEYDARRYDYMISPSKFCTEKYISAFNLKELKKENIVIEKGYPRNDFLFSFTKKDVEKIKKDLNIKTNKKIILYAPTWRDNQHDSKIGYTYSLGLDFDKLKKELEDEYVILFRTHAFVSNSFDFKKHKDFIYDVSTYDDINHLYVISDVLITDYSSVFFDYANLKRPILFYMYDLDLYKNKLRDFYLDLEELPSKTIEKENELIKEIKKSKNFKYNKKYENFNKKFNYLDDKNSSKRVIETIIR